MSETLERPDTGELEASEIGTQVHQILAGIAVDAGTRGFGTR